MAYVTESTQFEAGIYQLETTDKPLGGSAGIANRQAIQLANRTAWLKGGGANQVDLKSVFYGVTAADAGKVLRFFTSSASQVFLPTSGFPAGCSVTIMNAIISGGDIQITSATGTLTITDFATGDYQYILPSMKAVTLLCASDGVWYVTNVSEKTAVAVGSIITAAYTLSSTERHGMLYCNGAAIDRNLYANLFAKIGTTYGAGDGSTTFNIPDFRGVFLRGWDNSRGLDSGRTLGSYQADAYESHYHLMKKYNRQGGSGTSFFAMDDHGTDGSENTENSGGTETRPKNYAVNFYIKF